MHLEQGGAGTNSKVFQATTRKSDPKIWQKKATSLNVETFCNKKETKVP